uniref:J domain-containing protein n=1 Tax=Gongylonema pulchrum TaxID=637853 RepID=A0A183EKT6_9BILA
LVPTDTSRCGRKQRNSVRKRQNTVTDYINFTLSLLFSLVKSALQWIVNLVTDISMQLWDISIYISFWVNIRVFNAKRIWTSGKEPTAWGLVENIQLPATGEEAMERILKCRGRDAYVILGLRADCTDDDIKRYFKRQAVLVHPDKVSSLIECF